MSEIKDLELEKKELNALINNGVTFEVEVTKFKIESVFWII
jgi:hypothetical protein